MIVVTREAGNLKKIGYCDYTTTSGSLIFRKQVEPSYKAVPRLSKEMVSYRIVELDGERCVLADSLTDAREGIPSFKPLLD